MGDFAAIILAAGQSSRFHAGFGETKLVANLIGKPLVRHVAESALASRARPILVVTGHAFAKIEAALAGLELSLIANPNYHLGMSSSLKAGIAAVPHTAAGAVILLADMPRVSGNLINRLIEAFETSVPRPQAVAPVHAGSRGNPVLIGRTLFHAVAHLEGDRGARGLIETAGQNLLRCEVSDEAIKIDIDTKEDLRRVEAGWGRGDA
jgi:molybdenum cofactor cytidylyltransferase